MKILLYLTSGVFATIGLVVTLFISYFYLSYATKDHNGIHQKINYDQDIPFRKEVVNNKMALENLAVILMKNKSDLKVNRNCSVEELLYDLPEQAAQDFLKELKNMEEKLFYSAFIDGVGSIKFNINHSGTYIKNHRQHHYVVTDHHLPENRIVTKDNSQYVKYRSLSDKINLRYYVVVTPFDGW